MTWRTKARIQNLVAALPGTLSQTCYYRLQRWFGGWRSPTRESRVVAESRLAGAIRKFLSLSGMRVMEIGTGRALNVPIVMWLLGASRIFTVDLNRYLRPEIVRSDVEYYRSHQRWLVDTLSEHDSGDGSLRRRLDRLLAINTRDPNEFLDGVLQLCNIVYQAPADATALDLDVPYQPFDVHLSSFVLEHVPERSLYRILESAVQLLDRDGLCVHIVDLSDHYKHGDKTISRVNFLRFSDHEWHKYAGNGFMYMNRLRASQYLYAFDKSGLEVRRSEASVDDECVKLIEGGEFPLAERFRHMDRTDLATTGQLIVASPKAEGSGGRGG